MEGFEAISSSNGDRSTPCLLCCTTFCCTLREVFSFTIAHLGLIALMCGYCVAGGFLFEQLENQNEIRVKNSIRERRDQLADDIWRITETSDALHETLWVKQVEDRLHGFELELVHAMKKEGWNGFESHDDMLWTFPGSLFFSIVSLTTIGYGDQTPKTTIGKVIIVIYVILGMPLLLLCLGNTGKAMAKSFRFIYWRLCCYVCVSSKVQQRMVSSRSALGPSRSRRSLSYHHPSRSPPLRSMSVRSQASSTYGGLSRMSPESRRRSFRNNQCNWYSGSIQETSPDGLSPTIIQASNLPPDTHEDTNVFNFASDSKRPEMSSSKSETLMARDEFQRDNDLRASGRSRRSTKSLQLNLPSEKASRVKATSEYAIDSPGNCAFKVSSGDSSPSSPTTPVVKPPTLMMHQPRSVGGSFRSRRTIDDDSPEYPVEVDFYEVEDIWNKEVPVALCLVVVLAYVIGGSYLFSQSEGWTPLDSAYFCIVSLTTIGFGDFVPKTKRVDAEISIAICSTYLLFGMSLLVMTFNLVQERVIRKVRAMANALGIITDEELENMD